MFQPILSIQDRTKIFIYFKRRFDEELEYLTAFLLSNGVDFMIFDYVEKYEEEVYIKYLHESKYGIWLGAHESQGFALEEALSCDVPLLVWCATSMNQENGSNYPDIPASTIPYWDERCGEFFYDKEELETTFQTFVSKLEEYRPRDYILETLSIPVCEKRLIDLIRK
jgi:hypothetical protein